MQNERLARAQTALENGDMAVLPVDPAPQRGDKWIVVSIGTSPKGKKSQYTVTLDGDAWACTCPDFAGRCQRFGLLCKHIEAIRYLEARQIAEAGSIDFPNTKSSLPVQHTEDSMNQIPTMTLDEAGQGLPIAQMGMDAPPTDEVIWRLRQPLDMNRVKRRQAPGQGTVPYLEGFDVIEMANDLFLFRWSFDLLSEPKVMRWDKVITFYDQHVRKKVPALGEDGKPTTEVAGIVYLTGRVTIELGGKAYNHADVGRCIFSGDTPEALDMAIAGAATDCLKRCFRQCGEQFGLSLYDKEIARTAGLENGNSSETTSTRNGSPEPSPRTTSPVPASTIPPAAPVQPDVLQYRDGTAVEMSNTVEVTAFNTFKTDHQGLAPATRDVLRAWSARSNGKK
ncbi:MAG: Rad52/Rad22 family DNA repair protein [Anaerolineaceae bacterium]|nr:Rad52/Rad22 family DNA repair protein [Anaerolineaceae bacterium]